MNIVLYPKNPFLLNAWVNWQVGRWQILKKKSRLF